MDVDKVPEVGATHGAKLDPTESLYAAFKDLTTLIGDARTKIPKLIYFALWPFLNFLI